MKNVLSPETLKDVNIYRRFLAIAGGVYLIWWFAVEMLLPNAFNPLLGRALVVLFFFVILALSYFSKIVTNHIRILFFIGLWILTLHYYYLFHGNAADINWIIGAYVTVIAINLCLLSAAALLSYSIFVLILSVILVLSEPHLGSAVFLPGMITILIQANMGMRSKLVLMKTLADSNERFQLLFNSTFEGVLVHEQGRITMVNEALMKLTGYSRKELTDGDSLKVITPSERAFVAEKMRLADEIPYQTKGLTKNGVELDVELRGKNFQIDGQIARLVTVQDITDRKKAESEKIRALTLAENVRIRDEFISIASHELRTPISALKLQTKLIERDSHRENIEPYTPAKLHSVFSLFNRQIDRLIELVETMLDVSRISAGRLILNREEVDLCLVVKDVIATHGHEASIMMQLPESLIIWADLSRIKQVIENLVSNALKYGKNKEIMISLKTENEEAILTVSDQGIGIAPEYIERIFQRFERGISSQNISGLGLGLYIAQQIVEAHEGKISVQSQLNTGSTFFLRLPLVLKVKT